MDTYQGNAQEDGKVSRGWFIGHFVNDPSSLRFTHDVEIKVDYPPKGTKRDDWSINKTAHTMSLVIKGKFKIIFPDHSYELGPGDYFISAPEIPHKYEVLDDSFIITVRWPSLPSDHTNK